MRFYLMIHVPGMDFCSILDTLKKLFPDLIAAHTHMKAGPETSHVAALFCLNEFRSVLSSDSLSPSESRPVPSNLVAA
jgi:hypothetical protein